MSFHQFSIHSGKLPIAKNVSISVYSRFRHSVTCQSAPNLNKLIPICFECFSTRTATQQCTTLETIRARAVQHRACEWDGTIRKICALAFRALALVEFAIEIAEPGGFMPGPNRKRGYTLLAYVTALCLAKTVCAPPPLRATEIRTN